MSPFLWRQPLGEPSLEMQPKDCAKPSMLTFLQRTKNPFLTQKVEKFWETDSYVKKQALSGYQVIPWRWKGIGYFTE